MAEIRKQALLWFLVQLLIIFQTDVTSFAFYHYLMNSLIIFLGALIKYSWFPFHRNELKIIFVILKVLKKAFFRFIWGSLFMWFMTCIFPMRHVWFDYYVNRSFYAFSYMPWFQLLIKKMWLPSQMLHFKFHNSYILTQVLRLNKPLQK